MSPRTRAAAAAALLAVPVALETSIEGFGDSSRGELAFAASQLLGWVLLAGVCLALRAARPSATRAARIGSRFVLAGCATQVGFAVAYGALVAAGRDPGGAFLLFGVAFLVLTAGGLTWGLSLWRSGVTVAGSGLVAVAVLGLLALAVPVDPFHDVFLLGSYLAWVPVARGTTGAVRGRIGELSAA